MRVDSDVIGKVCFGNNWVFIWIAAPPHSLMGCTHQVSCRRHTVVLFSSPSKLKAVHSLDDKETLTVGGWLRLNHA